MSTIVCKYFNGVGFVAAKNRDCNYKPRIRIRKSFRNDIERLFLWDEVSRFSEGLNEHGLVVLVCPRIDIENEISDIRRANREERKYNSPEGLRVRKALYASTPEESIEILKEQEITGNVLVMNSEKAFVLDGSNIDGVYSSAVKELSRSSSTVISNRDDIKIPEISMSMSKTPIELMDVLMQLDQDDSPLRMGDGRGTMRTTGQLLAVPSENCLHYRPIWGDTLFRLDKLNSIIGRTFFEIVSARKLISSIQ
jgi:hypothetical protein